MPAVTTAANGTSLVNTSFVLGETRFSRGTMALRPSATEQEADTARKYDFAIVEADRGVDLFALALLMATLSDWLVICQSNVPAVYGGKKKIC
jgi:hypothetical protein